MGKHIIDMLILPGLGAQRLLPFFLEPVRIKIGCQTLVLLVSHSQLIIGVQGVRIIGLLYGLQRKR